MFAVSLACVMTTAIACAIVSRKTSLDTDSILVRTSLAALWLPALALFFHQDSVLTLAVVAIFAVMATRSFFLLRDDRIPLTTEESHPGLAPPMTIGAYRHRLRAAGSSREGWGPQDWLCF